MYLTPLIEEGNVQIYHFILKKIKLLFSYSVIRINYLTYINLETMARLFYNNRLVLMLLLGIMAISFNSCTKYSFMSMEDRIVGIWKFENVSFIKGFSLTRRDATNEYRNWEYEFTQDGRFFMRNTYASQTYEGKWYMTSMTNYDAVNETSQTIYDLHVSVYNPDTRDIEQFIWELSSITGKRLRATEYFQNETWYYIMYRL